MVLEGLSRVRCVKLDVRDPIPTGLASESSEWIFNLTAVHREPGHRATEYFETTLKGAVNVCAFANQAQARDLYLTSSISVYGPIQTLTPEEAPIAPISRHGGSKYPADRIQRAWLREDRARRLMIVRPGVVYGPGDPGNMLRMIRAIRRGHFAFPGSPGLLKSYAYIYGLVDSIDLTMLRSESLIICNYVESPTETLGKLVEQAKQLVHSRAPILSLLLPLLIPAAAVVSAVMDGKSPPIVARARVRPTHPRILFPDGS